MKVLLVDPEAERVPPLRQALQAAGAEVALAPSGSFALTMLEWNRQDVIVSRPHIGDMDAMELCSIVRADPTTREVRFVLVAQAGEVEANRTAAAGVDLVLPSDMTVAMILSLVTLMRRERERPAARGGSAASPAASDRSVNGTPPVTAATVPALPAVLFPPPRPASPAAAPPPTILPPPSAATASLPPTPVLPPSPPPSSPPADGVARADGRTLQGSLGVMRLEEITQAIAAGGKTGRLIVAVAGTGGLVAFERGHPVHAEYREETGEAALTTMIGVARREQAGRFCFIPGEPSGAPAPRSIERPLGQILADVDSAAGSGEAASASAPGER